MAASAPSSAVERYPGADPRAATAPAAASQLALAIGLDAVLLVAGLAIAVGVRLALGPLQWSGFSAGQYAACAAIGLVLLLYEGVYSGGPQALEQTDRIVKALTGGLAATIFYTFATQRSADISRFVLVAGYAADLLLFVVLRPVLTRWLQLGPRLNFIAGDDRAEHLVQRLAGPPGRSGSEASPAPGGPAVLVAALGPGGRAPEALAEWEQRFGQLALIATGTDPSALGAVPLNLHGTQVYFISHPLARRLNLAVKRACDCVGASLALLFAGPLLALLWSAVRLDSPGPGFYRQERLGRGGKVFHVWKLRTMHDDSEWRLRELLATDPAVAAEYQTNFKLRADPRVTRLGRALRRLSLDELPQFWNVLRGDMSLVGPRPIVAAERALYGAAYPLVATVRPGVTGVWQTSGRSVAAYETRAQFDVFYVRRWSLWLDLAVLVRTLQAMILPADY
ncbi:MAG: sugar transferase [Terriglobales bacterium]